MSVRSQAYRGIPENVQLRQQGVSFLVVHVVGSSDLTRITVDGSANNTDFLRFAINRPGAADVLSWEQVPYQAKA